MGRPPIGTNEKAARRRFGILLKQQREKLDIGLNEAARSIDMHHTSLSRIESGERPLTHLKLQRLASTYDVPWQTLVLAQKGQLPMALVAGVYEISNRGAGRSERLFQRMTVEEKQQLEVFLNFLRFKQQIETAATSGERE